MENRIDRLAAAHVDLSVAVSVAFGLAAGIESAHQLGVDLYVAQRVLIEGGPRRSDVAAVTQYDHAWHAVQQFQVRTRKC